MTAGDPDSFSTIYRDNKARIFRLCCAYCADPDDREDLMQMIFVNVWKNLGSFEGRSQIGTWIYRIAVNTALLFVRRRGRQSSRFVSIDLAETGMANRLTPETQLAEHEEVHRLYACINRLDELDRLVITMSLDGLSYDEISRVTGLSSGNVGVRLTRIRKKLGAMMKEGHHE